MTLRHLKIFITVVDEGGMTKAANKLYISQPSISQAIKELEEHYNIKLFERLSKKIYITKEGEKLLSYARHIINMFDEMDNNIKKEKQNKILKIGASITIGTCLLSNITQKFIQGNKVTIKSKIDNTTKIESLILKNELDFGLVEGPIHSKDIKNITFKKDNLIAVCSDKCDLKDQKNISSKKLSKYPFILREKGSGTRELFENKMKEKKLDLNVIWECNNAQAIKNAVISNIGITVISEMIVEKELKEKTLFKVNIKDLNLNRDFNIIYHKNKFITDEINSFWNTILNEKIAL